MQSVTGRRRGASLPLAPAWFLIAPVLFAAFLFFESLPPPLAIRDRPGEQDAPVANDRDRPQPAACPACSRVSLGIGRLADHVDDPTTAKGYQERPHASQDQRQPCA